MFNELNKQGYDYDRFARENVHTKEQVQEYVHTRQSSIGTAERRETSISNAPSFPKTTPGVDLGVQSKIDFKLAHLGIAKVIDHSKFIPLENDRLTVKVNKVSFE